MKNLNVNTATLEQLRNAKSQTALNTANYNAINSEINRILDAIKSFSKKSISTLTSNELDIYNKEVLKK